MSERRKRGKVRWLFILMLALTAASDSSVRAPAAPAPLSLDGTWYVLVHYRDAGEGHGQIDLWQDRIWIFKADESRLKWIEYPVVVFKDERKRFQRLPRGRVVRAEVSWLPSPKQHREIRDGLRVTTLNQRSKTLRGDVERGFRSRGSLRADSASVIGFSETWEVRNPTSLPVFLRSDTMDSLRTEGLQGVIRYQVRLVSDDGNQLEGDYDRDGTQRGTFQMYRAGEVTIIGTHPEPSKERG